MKGISKFTTINRYGVAVSLLLAAAASAFANIIGSDVLNVDGTIKYSYVVDNSTGLFDVAAWSLEFGFSNLDWNQLQVTLPNPGWVADVGTPTVGQSAQDFLSLAPAGDVGIGQSLLGFSFTSRFLPGAVIYNEFSADGDSISGTTIGPVSAVPEGDGPVEVIAIAAIIAFAARTKARRRKEPDPYAR